MSLLFIDEEQRLLKQPAEVWEIIFNFCREPDQFQLASITAIRKVFATLSKEFNKLVKKMPLQTPHPYGQRGLAAFLCYYGYTSLLKYALENRLYLATEATTVVSQNGHLDCLKVLLDHRCKLCPGLIDDAAQRGQLHVVEYLIGKGIIPVDTTMMHAISSGRVDLVKYLQNYVYLRAYSDIGLDATKSGSLEMVKYIEQYTPLEQKNIIGSALCGNVEILRYYINKGFGLTDHLVCLTAATKGHFNYVKLAIDHGAPMSEELMQTVAKMNDVELMQELRARGCPWDGGAIKEAASKGCFDALKFLLDNGCPFGEQAQNKWLRYGFGYNYGPTNEATLCAGHRGHVDCLKYLMEHGAPWPRDIITKLVFNHYSNTNLFGTLKYLREYGCAWDVRTTAHAAQSGNLIGLKFLHENKCPWDESTCESAAQGCKIDCLQYAFANNCPVDYKTMNAALSFGSLAVLKIVHEKGLPWLSDSCTKLLGRGTEDMLKYAHENGAPWAEDTIIAGLKAYGPTEGILPCLEYAVENGCPWNPQETLTLAKIIYNWAVIHWIEKNALKK